MSTNLTSSANSNTDSNFSLLPPSLSGQTLQSALDNLSKGSFSDLQYNGGSGGAPGSALDPGSIGGQTPGFGLSPSITPSKVIFVQYSSLFLLPFLVQVDYSDWGTGSTSGSAPGSSGKAAAPGHQDPFRAGGPDAVRRNLQVAAIKLCSAKTFSSKPPTFRTKCGRKSGATLPSSPLSGFHAPSMCV